MEKGVAEVPSGMPGCGKLPARGAEVALETELPSPLVQRKTIAGALIGFSM